MALITPRTATAASPVAKPAPKPEAPPSPDPLAPADAALTERAAKFDRLDKPKRGRLTREEYISRQSDPEAAAKRFEKFDSDRDGLEPAAPLPGVSTRVKCAVDFYGALDLPNYHDLKMFLQTRAENPAVSRKAAPVTYVKAGAAPLLLVHGTADETVPHSQAETMAAALKQAGVEHHLEIVPEAPHTFALVSLVKDFRPLVFGFLDTHLQPAKQ